jgi:hypothetical protein
VWSGIRAIDVACNIQGRVIFWAQDAGMHLARAAVLLGCTVLYGSQVQVQVQVQAAQGHARVIWMVFYLAWNRPQNLFVLEQSSLYNLPHIKYGAGYDLEHSDVFDTLQINY